MATSPKQDSPAPDQGVVNANVFIAGDTGGMVLFAGLLADQPDLRDAELSPDAWQSKLDAYRNSPRR